MFIVLFLRWSFIESHNLNAFSHLFLSIRKLKYVFNSWSQTSGCWHDYEAAEMKIESLLDHCFMFSVAKMFKLAD